MTYRSLWAQQPLVALDVVAASAAPFGKVFVENGLVLGDMSSCGFSSRDHCTTLASCEPRDGPSLLLSASASAPSQSVHPQTLCPAPSRRESQLWGVPPGSRQPSCSSFPLVGALQDKQPTSVVLRFQMESSDPRKQRHRHVFCYKHFCKGRNRLRGTKPEPDVHGAQVFVALYVRRVLACAQIY